MIKKRDNFNAVTALFFDKMLHTKTSCKKGLIFFGLKSQCIHFHLLQHS